MGYYYSLLEWYHPLYKKETINQYIDQHMFPQMKDLVNTYKPDVFWTDSELDITEQTDPLLRSKLTPLKWIREA
jgi:alpha-L-fucosidase